MTAQVLHLERAAGCRPELLELLEDWKVHGTFDIEVAVDGGYRHGAAGEQTQERFFQTGMSQARKLKETPHGRRCGLDCHPVGFRPNRNFESQPGMRELFLLWGAFVESRGLIWGGRFKKLGGGNGDLPHAELPQWRTRYTFPGGLPVAVKLLPPSPEKPKMSEQQKPSIGRIVHYQAHGSPDRTHKSEARPAIITYVCEDGSVDLTVFNPTGMFFNLKCAYSEEPKGGTWRWPSRVETEKK